MDVWDFVTSPQAWIVFIVVFIISYNYLVKESWRGLPPGPPALPLVGSLPFLGSDIREPFRKMAAKYGEVFTVYLGSKRVVVLNGYDSIREAHTKHANTFLDREIDFFSRKLLQGKGILGTNGPLWHEQRSFILHTLRDLGFGRSDMEKRILKEIQYFMTELQKQNGVPIYPIKLLQKSVANVVFAVLFGKRMEYTDPDYTRFIHTMETIVTVLGHSGILYILAFLRFLPGDMFRIKELCIRVDEILVEYQRMIDQRRAESEGSDNPTDFIGMYLQKIEAEKDDPRSSFTDNQLCHVVYDLFMAGAETTSTTLTWAILYMSLNQGIQARVQQEVDAVIGKGGIPSMRHRSKMPYTEACLYEIQRLGDVVPLPPVRCAANDVTLKGYLIPEGTLLLTNLNSVHHDPQLWPEPEVFKPERFLDEDGNIQRREELIPFMIGKRACIGEHLARMELFLYFTSMMANFQFRLAPGYPEPGRRGVLGLTNIPKPFYVIAETKV